LVCVRLAQDLDNHEVLATEREPEGQAQSAQQSWLRLNRLKQVWFVFGLHKIWIILAAPQQTQASLVCVRLAQDLFVFVEMNMPSKHSYV